jgi:hypothetical protein
MAKMIGKIRKMWYGQCKYGCCYMPHSKTAVKREEMSLALHEAEEEKYWWEDKAHERGMCYNQATKSYGCHFCEDLDDAYDNSDLDDIPGVWCNTDWRDDPSYQRYLAEERIYEED